MGQQAGCDRTWPLRLWGPQGQFGVCSPEQPWTTIVGDLWRLNFFSVAWAVEKRQQGSRDAQEVCLNLVFTAQ